MANSDYNRGDMSITDHKGTFSGFMGISKYGAVAIIIMLLFPILMFAVNLAWTTSLLVTVILGVILGVALKLKPQYFAGLIGAAVFVFIFAMIINLIF